jgi:hypothetical protein
VRSDQEANSAQVGRGGRDSGRRPEAGGLDLGRRRGGGAPLAQAVALALEADDVGVVDESVDERGGDHGVAEDLAPGFEAAVAGDDDRAALVAAGDEREEQVGRLAFEREVADLVDDQEVIALQAPQFVVQRVAVLGAFKPIDPLLGGGERDAMTAWQALIDKAMAKCVLPVPGGPKKQTLLCSVIQASWARCKISGFSAPGWALKSKSSSVLWAGKAAWRMRWRAPEASRAKTSASSSVSRNCS